MPADLALTLKCGDLVPCEADEPLTERAHVELFATTGGVPKAVPTWRITGPRRSVVRGLVAAADPEHTVVLVTERYWGL